jgi:hypothetical protein
MAPVPQLTIVEFAGRDDCRAFDCSEPLADQAYDSSATAESPMSAEVFLLVSSLYALRDILRVWLLVNTPDEPKPTRLLMQLEPGADWSDLENVVLDILAAHFKWPYVTLNNSLLSRTTCTELPPELTEH